MRKNSLGYWAALVAVEALVSAAIFKIPYWVPVAPSFSDSYLFHFNNRACWLLVLLAGSILVAFGPDVRIKDTHGKPISSSTLVKALIGAFGMSAFLYLWTRKLNGFDESIYLIDRVRLVLEGRVPYKQFEYAYGVLFLYLPAAIAHYGRLGAADGYGIFFVLLALLGTALLYFCVCWIDCPRASKRSVFLFFWAASLLYLLTLGVNYSLFRYVLPVFCCVVLYLAIARASVKSVTVTPFAWIVAAYALLLLDSPELAVAFCGGAFLYVLRFGRLRVVGNALFASAMVGAVALLTWAAVKAGAFRTMEAFRTGGANFPVMAAPHIVLLLLAVGLTACYTGTLMRSRENHALLPVVGFSIGALGAALGRCDPGHVLLNAFPLFMIAGLLSHGRQVLWRAFTPSVWFIFILLPLLRGGPYQVSQLGKAALPTLLALERGRGPTSLDRWVMTRMIAQLGPALAQAKFAEYRAAANRQSNLDLDRVFGQPAGTVYEAPYGFSVTHFGLFHSRQVDEGYFFETINLVTPQQVQQKVAELAANPERPLLLMQGRQFACGMSEATERALLSSMFMYPYRRTAVHADDVTAPLCDYILRHYQQTTQPDPAHFGYAVWQAIAQP